MTTHQALPPGPKSWHPLGQIFAFKRDLIGLLMNTARDYGDIAHLNMAGRTLFLINHPDHIQAVAVTDHHNFIKSRALRLMKRLLGNGLITSEGETHRRQQKMMQPMFRKECIDSYLQTMIEDIEITAGRWSDGETRDISQEMMKMSLGIATKTLFNSNVDDEAEEIGACLTVAMKMFERSGNPLAELLDKLPLPSNYRFRRAKERLDSTVRRMIRECRERGADGGDLLSTILKAQSEDDGSTMSDQQVVDEVLSLFVGGHETTANALTWTWYLLSQNPEQAAKLYAEIDRVLEGRIPTLADLPQLPYARMVFSEALRLYPPIYILAREALEDYPIGDYVAPKGTAIVFSPYVIHHDPRYYEDPDAFRPERWTPEEAAKRPKYAYIPFGAGPRGCIGEHFAWLEAVLALAIIGQKWRLDLAPGHRVELDPLLSLRPKFGMQMVIHRRAEVAKNTETATPSQTVAEDTRKVSA